MINELFNNSENKCLLIFTFCLLIYVIGNEDDLIYILIWSAPYKTPALNNEKGQAYFVKRNCSFQNCFLTNEHEYFADVRNFDVILFNVMTLNEWNATVPEKRSELQKYVLMSDEPPVLYLIPTHYNGFFNYTWTYKLNSDATWRFFIIRNKEGKVIQPKADTRWINFNDMKPISEEIKSKLQYKKYAAAWFTSHCETPSQREKYILQLFDTLAKYKLKVDTYGYCGTPTCPIGSEDCHVMIETDYYFFLVFENSMCPDYVTEKLLIPTQHYAVPIVYGGANYSRFLPNGSYLDASTLGPVEMASTMNDLIKDKNKYYDFFRWRRYYSYHASNETAETNEICAFCDFLNERKHTYIKSVYTQIKLFWM